MSRHNVISSASPPIMQPLGAKLTEGCSERQAASYAARDKLLATQARLDDVLLLQPVSHLGAQDLVALSAAPRAASCFAKA